MVKDWVIDESSPEAADTVPVRPGADRGRGVAIAATGAAAARDGSGGALRTTGTAPTEWRTPTERIAFTIPPPLVDVGIGASVTF